MTMAPMIMFLLLPIMTSSLVLASPNSQNNHLVDFNLTETRELSVLRYPSTNYVAMHESACGTWRASSALQRNCPLSGGQRGPAQRDDPTPETNPGCHHAFRAHDSTAGTGMT
jgi:hypothetical protein